MKKIISVMIMLVMFFNIIGCQNQNQSPRTDATLRIAFISDYDDIYDESFNQTTYQACKAFAEKHNIPFNYFKPTGQSVTDRTMAVKRAIQAGYNVIVVAGYAFAGTIVRVTKLYPHVKFIALDIDKGALLEAGIALKGLKYDYVSQNWKLDDYCYTANLYCAIYQEEISGFLAGFAAVKLGYKRLGILGGMAVPAVNRYMNGFVQGANKAAEEINQEIEIKYGYAGQFYSSPDIKSAMDVWFASGTEVVFACGGSIYHSVASAATKKDIHGKVIGVDVDQASAIDKVYGSGTVVTSAVKGLYPTVIATLTDVIVNDRWEQYAGKIEVLGLVSASDVEANYVQIPYESTQWSEKFNKEGYKALVAKLYAKEIIVSNDIANIPPTTKAKIINVGNIK